MKDLTQGKPFWVIFRFTIPFLIANLLSQTYNLIDLIIAGKMIGTDALSASGCSSTFIQFLSSLFWGFGVAVATTTGELYGADKKARIVANLKNVFIFITITMLVLSGICFIFASQIMDILKVDIAIKSAATTYFRIYMIALFFQSISYQITCALQSLGNSKFPMAMTIVSGAGNLILNIVFIACFKMGVEGLAYATLISCLIALIMGTIKIIKTIKELGGDLRPGFSVEEFKPLLKLAIPCILQQCSLYLSSVIVQPYINNMGKDVSAGYSIAMNVNLIFNAIYHSFSRSVASYVSQSKGKRLYQNYHKGLLIGVLQQIILLTPLLIICSVFATPIFKIFMRDNDVNCLPYALEFAKICFPFIYVAAFGNLMHSFYKAVGAGKTVLFSTIIFSLSRIGLTYLLPPGEYLFSVYLSLGLSWLIEAILLLIIYFTRLWLDSDARNCLKTKRKPLSSN